jgi:hypothetical protein
MWRFRRAVKRSEPSVRAGENAASRQYARVKTQRAVCERRRGGKEIRTKRPGRAHTRPGAADQSVALASPEKSLSRPVVVYDLIAKYHVPVVRPSITTLLALAPGTLIEVP